MLPRGLYMSRYLGPYIIGLKCSPNENVVIYWLLLGTLYNTYEAYKVTLSNAFICPTLEVWVRFWWASYFLLHATMCNRYKAHMRTLSYYFICPTHGSCWHRVWWTMMTDVPRRTRFVGLWSNFAKQSGRTQPIGSIVIATSSESSCHLLVLDVSSSLSCVLHVIMTSAAIQASQAWE